MEPLSILIVDDEIGMRLGIRRVLRDFRVQLPDFDEEISFQLDEADSVDTAIAKIDQAPPDLVLVDYKLPGKSGLELLEMLAARKLQTLAIMITAYASIETAISATKRGAYDLLAKPFSPDELKSTIQKAANRLIFARQARELAHERRQIRFKFVSVLAHELQAPLGAIEGYLRIVRDHSAGDDPEVYRAMMDRSLDRVEGMRKMILDLLDLTRIESGQKNRELVDLDLVAIARRAVETAMPDALRRSITINLEAPAPVPLRADHGEIEIIFNNLLSNAIKYNVEGGRVEVAIRAIEGRAILTVRDTGIGMAPEESARLFSDFVRIKNSRTRDILGSGLGLSIVHKLAALYGGSVAVDSRPDEGSTFTVQLRSDEAN